MRPAAMLQGKAGKPGSPMHALLYASIIGLVVFSIILGAASLFLDVRSKKQREARQRPGYFDLVWLKPDTTTGRVRARVLDLTDAQATVECSTPLVAGVAVYLENRAQKLSGNATVTRCKLQSDRQYRIALELQGAMVPRA